MMHVAPNTVIAAQVYNFEGVVQEIIDSRANGVLGGKAIPLTLANGLITMQYSERIPQNVMEAVEKTKADIVSGALVIDVN